MTLDDKLRTMLRDTLELTRDREIDCDEFAAELAAYVEQSVRDPELVALLDHHVKICSECAEELELVRRALEQS